MWLAMAEGASLQEAADLLDEGAESVAVNYWTGFTQLGDGAAGCDLLHRRDHGRRPHLRGGQPRWHRSICGWSCGANRNGRSMSWRRSARPWSARLADAVEVVAANSGDGAERLREVLGESEGQRRYGIGRHRLERNGPPGSGRSRRVAGEHVVVSELRLLELVQRLAALSQTGLAFAESPFDIQRYEEVGEIAAELASHGEADALRVAAIFRSDDGYVTPKMIVRSAVFSVVDGRPRHSHGQGDRRWPLDPARRLDRSRGVSRLRRRA